jgi:threonine/homoserine/homoserine lactone efflux protein
VTAFLTALLPSAGVLLIFWIAVKAMLEADRRERSAQARFEAAERGKNTPGAPSGPPPA